MIFVLIMQTGHCSLNSACIYSILITIFNSSPLDKVLDSYVDIEGCCGFETCCSSCLCPRSQWCFMYPDWTHLASIFNFKPPLHRGGDRWEITERWKNGQISQQSSKECPVIAPISQWFQWSSWSPQSFDLVQNNRSMIAEGSDLSKNSRRSLNDRSTISSIFQRSLNDIIDLLMISQQSFNKRQIFGIFKR